jgi:hypothetical protein
MRVLKGLAVVVAFFLLAKYFPVVYHAIEFNDFVKQEAQRSQIGPQLQKASLDQAQIYFLPVKPDDIRINEDGDLIRVTVDYKVPVNLFVFIHELSFHARGAGLAPRPN